MEFKTSRGFCLYKILITMNSPTTVLELANFQLHYLKKIVENIPNEQLYERQLAGFNSAGWVLGHLCVEAEDVFDFLNVNYPKVPENWHVWFRNTTGKVESLEGLPSKEELLKVLDDRYAQLLTIYKFMTDEERQREHPSELLIDVVSSLDAWFAHHITTHIAIHCGNISVWKKLIGLEVGGY